MQNFNDLILTWSVKSLANGNMLVEPVYRHGVPGGLGRMLIAEEISDAIQAAVKKEKKRTQIKKAVMR